MSGPRAVDVVCFSLEPWDEVWRRNQLLTTELLELRPSMRLLFAEQPVDVTWSLLHRQRPRPSRLRPVGSSGRLWAMAPRKWVPRALHGGVDRSLGRQVLGTARRLGFHHPVLWINDSSYAALADGTSPCLYDVTDDWLLGHAVDRELERQRSNDRHLLEHANEVVVCSPALAASRGERRTVHLIPNAVDPDHLRRPHPRPADFPAGRVVVYLGTLSEGRLDIDLCADIATKLAGRATFVLVGPNHMSLASTERLRGAGALILGARPYATLPGYLQHADVLLVPHAVNPFTESLDPIKAREFQAVARPTLATPVAGFRGLGAPIEVAPAERYVDALIAILDRDHLAPGAGPLTTPLATWHDRATEFLALIDGAVASSTVS
jgi:glycosyltransferase involved in cell wall biosynthesis